MSSAEQTSTRASGRRPDVDAPTRDTDARSEYNILPSLGRVAVTGHSALGPQSVQDRSVVKKPEELSSGPYDFSRENREQIYQIATALSFRRGTTLFSQGADAHFIYFIDQGIVRLSRFAENGHRQVLGFRSQAI